MPLPTVRVLGVHPIAVTPALLAEALALKFGTLASSGAELAAAEAQVRAELEAAALLEVTVSDRDSHFTVEHFGQAGSDQAPYSEVFLSSDGSTIISTGFEIPAGPDLRLAFFLHFLNSSAPLRTSYGAVELPKPAPMPERLATLLPYDPVD